MAQGNNRKQKLEDVSHPFRPARSVSGTRRRVTTDELQQFRKEHVSSWPSALSPQVETPESETPGVPAARGSLPSIPTPPSPWLHEQPTAPPPPSPWVPAADSIPPAPLLPKKVAPTAKAQVFSGSDALRVATLSSVAGYVDAAGFLSLFGLLPAHMTGDLVWAGAAVADRADVGWLVRIAMVLLFVCSVAVAAVAARIVRRRGQSPLPSLLSLMTIALGVFWAAGMALGPLMTGPEGTATLFISGAGVMAMGIQNALMREALGALCPTTVMTGNLTQVIMDVVELVFASFDAPARRPERRRKEALARIGRFGLPVASFTFGAIAGACATNALGFMSLAVPTLLSLLLTAHSFRLARS
jgi:uncharacterized membrane protein YoaK (UPF0700 family)